MKEFFTLRSQLSELTTLSAKLQELADRWMLPKRFLLEVNLVLDEYITNIIQHGEAGKECTISVAVVKQKNCITIEVTDDGPPFDPTMCTMPDTTLSLDKRKCGGLGILLVHKFSDSCSYKRCNNTNIFKLKKYLPKEDR